MTTITLRENRPQKTRMIQRVVGDLPTCGWRGSQPARTGLKGPIITINISRIIFAWLWLKCNICWIGEFLCRTHEHFTKPVWGRYDYSGRKPSNIWCQTFSHMGGEEASMSLTGTHSNHIGGSLGCGSMLTDCVTKVPPIMTIAHTQLISKRS